MKVLDFGILQGSLSEINAQNVKANASCMQSTVLFLFLEIF